METFVRTFTDRRLGVAVDLANMYANNHSCEIISAQLCVTGDGRPSEMSCLVVVFKKIRKRVTRSEEAAENKKIKTEDDE